MTLLLFTISYRFVYVLSIPTLYVNANITVVYATYDDRCK